MNQPLTLHWKSPGHYSTAILTPDLFGGWVLVTTLGTRDAGRVRQKVLTSYEQGIEAVCRLRHRRRLEGYDLCDSAFTQLNARALPGATGAALLLLFKSWGLNSAEQAALLGIDAHALGQIQDGCAFPEVAVERGGHLLAINKSLRLRFNGDAEALRAWLRHPSPSLRNQSPLQVMIQTAGALPRLRGHLGLESVQDAQAINPASRNP